MREKKPTTRIERTAQPHGRRWRNRYVVDGKLVVDSYATEGEAIAAAKTFQRDLAKETGETVEQLLTSWIASCKDRGAADIYLSRIVRSWHGDLMDIPAVKVTEAQLLSIFKVQREKYTAATSRHRVCVMRQFYGWAVSEKRLSKSPMANIRELRPAKRGKVQIETLRDLYAFRDVAWTAARGGDLAALGVLVGLYVGARSGEVLRLRGRHVDLGSRLIIPGTKSDAAKRAVTLAVPELTEMLEARAKVVGLDGELVPLNKATLARRVKALAKAAGVERADELCFHSLRGTVASLAASSADVAQHAVASLLGHSSFGMTARHYASQDSQAQRGAAVRLQVLDGGLVGNAESPATKGENLSEIGAVTTPENLLYVGTSA